MACGCSGRDKDEVAPVQKRLVSEETTTRDNEIEIVQKFDDGSEKKLVVKKRNVGFQRKLL